MTKSGISSTDMTDQQVAEARERFREESKSAGIPMMPAMAAAAVAWDRGFADALKIVTGDMREMRVNLERRQAYDGRRG